MTTTTRFFFSDMGVMLWRSMRHIFRSMDTITTTTIMPIAMLLLFVYVFGGAIQTGTAHYVDYILPGILLVTVANGVGYTSYRLFTDVQRGIFDRFHAMPIARSSALWGHVLTSKVSNAISLAVVVVVALLMGYHSSAGLSGCLAVAGILALVTLTLTWIAAIAGLTAKTMDGAVAIAYPITMLPFISSAFVPTHSMPSLVRAFAEHQPMTAIAESVRALLTGHSAESDLWVALAWCIGILILAYLLTMRAYNRQKLSR